MCDNRDQSIPILIDDEILLRRLEDDNYIHLRTKSAKNIIKISRLGDYILTCCNGKNTVSDIISLISRSFPYIQIETIKNDVDTFLHQMWNRYIIRFIGFNYLIDYYSYNVIVNDFTFNYLELQDIININRQLQVQDQYYINPYTLDETKIELSTHWATKEESWFSVNYNSIPILYLSVRPSYGINVFYICKACFLSENVITPNIFTLFLQYIIGVYQHQFSKKFISGEDYWFIQYTLSSEKKIHSCFQLNGKLESEIQGQDVFVYSLQIKEGG